MITYKRYSIVDKLIIIDWKATGDDWHKVKDEVKQVLLAKFIFSSKTWQLPRTDGAIEQLRKLGYQNEQEAEKTVKDSLKLPVFQDHTEIELTKKLVPKSIRNYQVDAIQFILSRGSRCMLGLGMGSGKSLISSIVMAHHYEDKPWLFVVPASLKITLHNEIKKWTKLSGFVAYSNFTKDKIKSHHSYIVINYDILHKVVHELSGNICGVICDEAHYVANEKSKRSMAVQALVKTVDKAIFMSGTLLKNKPIELWPILNMVDPKYWSDKRGYIMRYCGTRVGYAGALVHDGAYNLDELHTRISPWLYYKSMEEILPELPPVQDMFYNVEINDKDFIKANKEIENLIEAGNTDRATILEKMSELTRSAFFHKRKTFYELVDDYIEQTGEKVVLVGVHKTVIADMVAKYDCEFISGIVPSTRRNAIVERFHTSDKKVLVLQLESANAGFSILCSRTMFFGETNYSFTSYSQMKARVRRMNTVADKCMYYHLVGEDTIEERILKLMAKKENIASQVIAGVESTVLDDANYENLLIDD